jgi:hypothetical protein
VSGYHDAARPTHAGIDLAARPGDPVAAASVGRVTFVGSMQRYGNVIALTHANGLTTIYAHLGDVRVAQGAEVLRGQTIATIGEEGYLHYEIRDAAGAVDPAKYYATAPRPVMGGAVDVRERVAAEPPEIGVLGGQPQLIPSPTMAPERPTTPPTRAPSPVATRIPTAAPTFTPTAVPTLMPTVTPTPEPTAVPTLTPTRTPTSTTMPTLTPTATPTRAPTRAATRTPSAVPPLTPRRREPTSPPQAVQPPTPPPVLPTPVATPEPEARESVWGGIAFGAALVGTNLLYVPAKLGYAALGTVIGGFALVLARDREVAAEVWWPALGGDFFVTAAHLRGEEPIHFMGSSSETPEPPAPR